MQATKDAKTVLMNLAAFYLERAIGSLEGGSAGCSCEEDIDKALKIVRFIETIGGD